MSKIYCRSATSLGKLEDTPENIWGTKEYEGDRQEPTLFFGLYGLPDFYQLWRHKGKKWILWAGSDITHFKNGYWLDEKGDIRIYPRSLAQWIDRNCESWVENHVEKEVLNWLGISAKVNPSFLGRVEDYKISFVPGNKVYTSVSGNNFELYGWDKIPQLSKNNPNIEFHLYGNTIPWNTKENNVKVHGRVSKEKMNEEIKDMQGALRLTEFDGFSEILAKSVLWGQWPISIIEYPYMFKVADLNSILLRRSPNYRGREYYLRHLNKFPWNVKNN